MFKPLREKRAFEEIADQIRDLIFAKKLNAGEKLPSERLLSEQFKAGRTVVREALRTLEQSGLICIKQGSEGGAFIRDADVSIASESIISLIRRSDITVEHLTEVRIGIEKLIIGPAIARITENDINLLKNSIEEAEDILADAVRGGELPELHLWAKVNSEFHLILARATNNPLYEMILKALMDVVEVFIDNVPPIYEFFEEHIRDHKAVFEAIQNHDLRVAERQLESHGFWVEKSLDFCASDRGKPRNNNGKTKAGGTK